MLDVGYWIWMLDMDVGYGIYGKEGRYTVLE